MNNRKKVRKSIAVVLVVMLAAALGWIVWGNTALEINEYRIKSPKLPENFEGFRIAQVSDLHNAQMGENNEKLLDMLKKAEPDIIAITGDMIDSTRTNTEIALQFAKQAVEIAPCFYVTGNHEARVPEITYENFEKELKKIGVHVLRDKEIILEKDGEQIALVGIDDPAFAKEGDNVGEDSGVSDKINGLFTDNRFKLLLSHRPELFDEYVRADVNLVLTGHAHGGQFRLPVVGGLVAPNQGLFPKYDAGLFTEGNTNMIVSRGIGNSIIPVRINNRPEVVLIEFG